MSQSNKFSLDKYLGGALLEDFTRELDRVIENVHDPNTSAKNKRKIKVEVVFAPDDDRELVMHSFQVKSMVSPRIAKTGRMITGINIESGRPEYSEFKSDIAGQISMDDEDDGDAAEDAVGNVVDLRKNKKESAV